MATRNEDGDDSYHPEFGIGEYQYDEYDCDGGDNKYDVYGYWPEPVDIYLALSIYDTI